MNMRIVGPHVDEYRPAVDVAKERSGGRIPPGDIRPGELWGAYAARKGITQQENARFWWEMTQSIDAAYGLPRDPEPDWRNAATLAKWSQSPWLSSSDQTQMINGIPIPGGGLANRIAPWERVQPSVAQIGSSLPPITSAAELIARSSMVDAALSPLLPTPQTQQLPRVAMTGMSGSTVKKYLAKGLDLAWEGGKVVLKEAGKSVVPVLKAVDTAMDVHDAVQWLDEQGVPGQYLPKREYQLASNSYIYVWPNGERTAAPPP
ncbi:MULTISPECIES: hypothetical protein [unclassified Streptomyces]|uniref:hypothetical protein n=1 Tax=Streptomyces sp. NPDC127129 TaxID=3345373 RepID=UPI003625314B